MKISRKKIEISHQMVHSDNEFNKDELPRWLFTVLI